MQIMRETSASNVIGAVESNRVRIGEQWWTGNLIVTAERIVSDWRPVRAPHIDIADLEPALQLKPELIVIGAGARPGPPDVDLMAALAELAVGLEFMNTAAACRTYNVLVHEGRRVAAALIIDDSSG